MLGQPLMDSIVALTRTQHELKIVDHNRKMEVENTFPTADSSAGQPEEVRRLRLISGRMVGPVVCRMIVGEPIPPTIHCALAEGRLGTSLEPHASSSRRTIGCTPVSSGVESPFFRCFLWCIESVVYPLYPPPPPSPPGAQAFPTVDEEARVQANIAAALQKLGDKVEEGRADFIAEFGIEPDETAYKQIRLVCQAICCCSCPNAVSVGYGRDL